MLPSKTLQTLLDAQTQRAPDSTAIVFGTERVSLAALRQRGVALGHHLRALGVGPGVVVGIFVERTPAMIVALLGVLKAGGAYLPLDPAYPAKRLDFMITDAGAPVVLTQEHLRHRLSGGSLQVVCLDDDGVAIGRREIERRENGRAGTGAVAGDLAFVLYTSGSTGQPKGVAIEHRSVVELLAWAQGVFVPELRRGLCAATSICFDLSVFEIFLPLSYGGTVVLARNPLELPSLPAAGEVTLVNTVPSAMDALLRDATLPASVRAVVLAGEPLSESLVRRIYESTSVERVFNGYGPTESTVYATFAEIPRGATGAPPIGRPVTGTKAWVLDSELRNVAGAGTPGRLYLSGAGLARGYLHRPAQTAERFLPHPSAVGERIYCTGDVVRQGPDGQLVFLGREDHQVKLHGHRIELGEIESVLRQMPEVREAVVQVCEEPPSARASRVRRLAAYVTLDRDHALPLPQWQLHRLPSEIPISTPNPAEADHLYARIFSERAYLRHGVRLTEGDCVFDVGANVGLFSLFAVLECRNPRIFAFEPVRPVFDRLRANAELWGIDVTALACGLSDASRTVRFTFYPKWSALSGAYANRTEEEQLSRAFLGNQDRLLGEYADELIAGRFEGEPVVCAMKTVSEVMREHRIERLDLLKVNVEKSELDVLRGVEPRDWPKVRQSVVEVHDSQGRLEATRELLAAQGFTLRIEQDPVMANTGLFMVYAWRSDDDRRPAASVPAGDPAAGDPASRLPGLRRSTVSLKMLRGELRQRLPEHMVPQVFAALERMPRTPNGKIDRNALPALDQIPTAFKAAAAYSPPRGALERTVAEIFQQALGDRTIGTEDNFFDVGGHSLLLFQVHARLRQLGHHIPLLRLLELPSIRSVARYLDDSPNGDPEAPARSSTRPARRFSVAKQRQVRRQHRRAGTP